MEKSKKDVYHIHSYQKTLISLTFSYRRPKNLIGTPLKDGGSNLMALGTAGGTGILPVILKEKISQPGDESPCNLEDQTTRDPVNVSI